jgi:hypothetical protein
VYALQNYSRQPASFVRRTIANFSSLWYLSESSMKSAFIGMLQISLLGVSVISIFMMKRETRMKSLPIILLVAYYVCVNSAIVGWARYSMPMIPFLLLFASPFVERNLFRAKQS